MNQWVRAEPGVPSVEAMRLSVLASAVSRQSLLRARPGRVVARRSLARASPAQQPVLLPTSVVAAQPGLAALEVRTPLPASLAS